MVVLQPLFGDSIFYQSIDDTNLHKISTSLSFSRIFLYLYQFSTRALSFRGFQDVGLIGFYLDFKVGPKRDGVVSLSFDLDC